MKSTQSYTAELEAITKRFEDDLTALGEKIRTELVIPACKKHKLYFVSGMGSFYFGKAKSRRSPREPMVGDAQDLDFKYFSESAQETLRPILDLLNRETSHGQYLGYEVADVD